MRFIYLILLCITITAQAQQQNAELPTATLASQGIDAALIGKAQADIDSGVYPNIHSLLIARHGKLVYEHYWPGKDEIMGRSLGIVPHGTDSLHDMRSVTKSFVGACIGIAIAQGKIKSIDQPVFDFFPEYAQLDTGMKKTLTLRHLLTMSSGLDWDESRPYTDPRNSEIAMDISPDPIAYILSRPMVAVPGTVWKYNGGTTEVLAYIIKKVSGQLVDEFANENLFKPLGIEHWQWIRIPQVNRPSAAAGLRLRSRDLLKFGLLNCQKGSYNGKQLIPAAWVDSSLTPHITRDKATGDGGYGYQFWTFLYTTKDGAREIPTGVGNGDQRVYIDRKNSLVVVITGGKYNQWTIKKSANALMGDYIYPALQH